MLHLLGTIVRTALSGLRVNFFQPTLKCYYQNLLTGLFDTYVGKAFVALAVLSRLTHSREPDSVLKLFENCEQLDVSIGLPLSPDTGGLSFPWDFTLPSGRLGHIFNAPT